MGAEMSGEGRVSGRRGVGVEGNEENICHIWEAFWFTNRRSPMSKGENEKAKLMCQFLEQNCL